jgi:succinate-acetate transporter protein
MGWRGTNIGPNTGAANMYGVLLELFSAPADHQLTVCSGDYFFIGGPLLLIAGLLEFFLGNTFTFVVFVSYCEFRPSIYMSQRPAG